MRTSVVKLAISSVQGICLDRQQNEILELPSHTSNIVYTILRKYCIEATSNITYKIICIFLHVVVVFHVAIVASGHWH